MSSMRGQRIGALIGAVSGLTFIETNAANLHRPIGAIVRVDGVAVFLVVLWFAVLRPDRAVHRRAVETDSAGCAAVHF